MALHAHESFAEAKGWSGTLRTPGSLMEDLCEVMITQGLFSPVLVQSLSLDTKCNETYSRLLQVTLLREHLTLPISKITLPFWYVRTIHCNLP